MRRIVFRIPELMVQKSRQTGQKVTYTTINKEVGVGLNTLSRLRTGKAEQVSLNTILKLVDYFDCSLNDLMVIEELSDDPQ